MYSCWYRATVPISRREIFFRRPIPHLTRQVTAPLGVDHALYVRPNILLPIQPLPTPRTRHCVESGGTLYRIFSG